MQGEAVLLARRAGQRDRPGKLLAGLCRVVAAEIDRFTHFRDGVGLRAAAFANDQGDQFRQASLQQIGGAVEE
ncbi:MAG: hypothetical protein AW09_003559 [Candidatus Accumulibacter phosphatis]|uniref:Uncharacterized protein n=1 Tax=Candidatus Accumulibacter phosphatis TaxID=327160 RepID=A0A080LSE3_9PROT|nr:MAG: hypothetical protein AW09_003559 [Candidatus Accumulibacter phosphatis]